MRLASRFGRYNSIRRERPLTDDELMQFVPSVFSGDKHESRSERYTYIPTINIMATRRRISPGRFHRSLLPISMISSIKRPVFLLTVAVFMNRTQFWITVNGYAFLFRSSFRMGVTGLKYCA